MQFIFWSGGSKFWSSFFKSLRFPKAEPLERERNRFASRLQNTQTPLSGHFFLVLFLCAYGHQRKRTSKQFSPTPRAFFEGNFPKKVSPEPLPKTFDGAKGLPKRINVHKTHLIFFKAYDTISTLHKPNIRIGGIFVFMG